MLQVQGGVRKASHSHSGRTPPVEAALATTLAGTASASATAAPAPDPTSSLRDWTPEVTSGAAVIVRSNAPDPTAALLSNMHPCGLVIDGRAYPSAEHAFQCLKMLRFGRTAAHDRILREAKTPKGAKAMGGKRGGAAARLSAAELAAWNEGGGSVDAMRRVMRAKYVPGYASTAALLATGTRPLVEKLSAFPDRVWGVGADNRGENRLGVLLMELRAELAHQL